MKIDNQVEMLEVEMNMMSGTSVIYPTIIRDDRELILVDTGFPGQLSKLSEAMDKAAVSINAITRIILTHQDIDHIGSLPGILESSGNKIEVICHQEEKPYIQGEKRAIKLTPERFAQIDAMPEPQRKIMQWMDENFPKAPVDKAVGDGEELPYAGGIVVIHTPGHTPGHICLFLKKSRTLIAGDALNVVEGNLVGPNPQHTFDMKLAVQSLLKLTQYDIETVISYHGGLYRGDIPGRIGKLATGSGI